MFTRDIIDLIDRAPAMPWLDDAACAGLPLDDLGMFFVEAGHSISAKAIATCTSCPVRTQCVQHAYRNEITSGYFGGMSPGKRRVVPLERAVRLIRADESSTPIDAASVGASADQP